MKKHLSFVIIALLLITIGCKKSSTTVPNQPVDVYIAGTAQVSQDIYAATYWKNGQQTVITNYQGNNSQGNSIAINSTGDIYLCGSNFVSSDTAVATVWINGKPTYLTDTSTPGSATGITIYRGDVYILGTITNANGKGISVYWKNGVETQLNDSLTSFFPNTMAVNANGIYFGGYIVGDDGIEAAYWFNGKVNILSTAPGSTIRNIVFNGNDWYMVGNRDYYTVAYWKNGVSTTVYSDNYDAEGYGIAVSGTNVYVTGSAPPANNSQANPYNLATLWKVNGSAISTTQYPKISQGDNAAGAMAINGSDIYINVGGGYLLNGTYTALKGTVNSSNSMVLVPN